MLNARARAMAHHASLRVLAAASRMCTVERADFAILEAAGGHTFRRRTMVPTHLNLRQMHGSHAAAGCIGHSSRMKLLAGQWVHVQAALTTRCIVTVHSNLAHLKLRAVEAGQSSVVDMALKLRYRYCFAAPCSARAQQTSRLQPAVAH